VRDTTIVGGGNIIFCLKVPRHCPLVLLIGVRLEFRANSIIFFYFLLHNIYKSSSYLTGITIHLRCVARNSHH
jgi:hypothetical protein